MWRVIGGLLRCPFSAVRPSRAWYASMMSSRMTELTDRHSLSLLSFAHCATGASRDTVVLIFSLGSSIFEPLYQLRWHRLSPNALSFPPPMRLKFFVVHAFPPVFRMLIREHTFNMEVEARQPPEGAPAGAALALLPLQGCHDILPFPLFSMSTIHAFNDSVPVISRVPSCGRALHPVMSDSGVTICHFPWFTL